ncbi:MAG: carboxylesterase family protein [Selenomonadaceae bacterium]|nr:carboxylesterase family protein [Selenomonadaceae bacterium]
MITKITKFLVLIMLLSITILPTSEVSAESPQVKVTGGMIQGYIDEYGVKTFKGIPFADTTAGKNRWKAPQPVKSWQGVKDCTKFGQSNSGTGGASTIRSLDC